MPEGFGVTTPEIADRNRIFKAALPYFGTVQSSAFFQRTSTVLPGVERIHNLIEGIYKPGGWVYPLSIASMLKSRYSDQLFHNPDRTWWMEYSPKAGGMGLAVNAGLIRCMTDRQPLLVLRQESDKTSATGSRHLLLGLGYIETFDPATQLFRIRGLTFDEIAIVTATALSEESDELIETALRLESLEEWVPLRGRGPCGLPHLATETRRSVPLRRALQLRLHVRRNRPAVQISATRRGRRCSHHWQGSARY